YMGKARERNTGWRIDYFITSKRLDDKIQEAKIHQQIFGSDHCPVELVIDL
ncbi:MAG: exodeoxyribonuclease III, partial [Veillonella sp.]|nr:exodeoxyribonuclease III [Veillonella sp.]